MREHLEPTMRHLPQQHGDGTFLMMRRPRYVFWTPYRIGFAVFAGSVAVVVVGWGLMA